MVAVGIVVCGLLPFTVRADACLDVIARVWSPCGVEDAGRKKTVMTKPARADFLLSDGD